VLLPVVAGRLESVVHALPARVFALLEQEANVPTLVRALVLPAEVGGEGSEQRVGACAWARHVDDDRGKRHRRRSYPLVGRTVKVALTGGAAPWFGGVLILSVSAEE
jgi:hypothetical protein